MDITINRGSKLNTDLALVYQYYILSKTGP